jgi:hypothetical protein
MKQGKRPAHEFTPPKITTRSEQFRARHSRMFIRRHGMTLSDALRSEQDRDDAEDKYPQTDC